jgi:GTP-binding protein Era
VRTRSRRKPEHRSGFVSIVGRPNVGKSTLLNALCGTKLAIVADKPQTTRTVVQGVLTLEQAQVVFLDSPGIHPAQSKFNRRMMKAVEEALGGRDLLIYVADATKPVGEADAAAVEWLKRGGAPALLALNKIDRVENKTALLPLLQRYQELFAFEEYLPLSALTGEGLEDLKKAILARLPEGPAYFPEDHITDQPERFLASELIREQVLAATRQEVPHATAVTVDEWDEEGGLVRLSVTIHVERPGQKVIVVGTRGARLKEIGARARLQMEGLFGKRFYVTLFVKVNARWRENDQFLNEMDWRSQ